MKAYWTRDKRFTVQKIGAFQANLVMPAVRNMYPEGSSHPSMNATKSPDIRLTKAAETGTLYCHAKA